MKKNKSLLLLVFCLVLAVGFTSCSKKLKDDLKAQDAEIAALKALEEANSASNASNTNNLNGVIGALGYNSPFTMSLTTKNTSDSVITVNKTYRFYTGPDYTNMENNNDGTWNVYLYVSEVAYWDNDARITCTYNPTTKVVTNARVNLNYYDYQYNYKNPQLRQSDTEATVNFVFNTFNTTTGAIDATISGSTTDLSTNNIYSGKGMTLSFHYAGTLTVFQ